MLRAILTSFVMVVRQGITDMPTLAAFGLVAAFAALAGTSWGREVAWGMNEASRRKSATWIGLSLFFWGVFAWGMFSALPVFGLSYGAIGFGFCALLLAHAGSFALTAFIIKWGSHWRAEWREPDHARRQLAFLGLVNLGISITAGYSLYFEPFNLQTTRIHIAGPDLIPDRALRILQISDLHVERLTSREQLVLQQVEALQPDLIVLTGDYLNLDFLGDPAALAEARHFLSQLEAPHGVFAVSGTVDSPDLFQALLDGLPIVPLNDQKQSLHFAGGEFLIIGIANIELNRDRAAFAATMRTVEEKTKAFSLLLYHSPDLILEAADAGIDAYLAGHTHGGQIRLPLVGEVVTFSIYGKRFASGAHQVEDTFLYVSRGLGMEGMGLPRARFLCPPELVLVEIGASSP